MPRHEASKPGFRLPAKTVLADPAMYLHLPSRDFSNQQSLQRLFQLCESLETWAKRFAPTAPLFALTAASTSEEALARLLECIIEELDALTPRCSPDAQRPKRAQGDTGKPWERTGLSRVEDLVNVFSLLPEYVLGTFEYEPEAVDTAGKVMQPSENSSILVVRTSAGNGSVTKKRGKPR
jgi:hypothetical protein